MKRLGTPIWAVTDFVKKRLFLPDAPSAKHSGRCFLPIVENNFDAGWQCDIKPLQTVVLSRF
jgi:hypothetical protein